MDFELLHFRPSKRVPLPAHRHAIPSGPWPWLDLESESNIPIRISPCHHENCDVCPQWLHYPQSHFPSWSPDQVSRSKIAQAIANRQHNCRIFHVDVCHEKGVFKSSLDKFLVTNGNHKELWDWLKRSSMPTDLRARVLFIENMSGPVLQIIGASYNIEPFFFSSSLNWIPSRYQEDVCHGHGDHITITLTFLRTTSSPPTNSQRLVADNGSSYLSHSATESHKNNIINVQAPLTLQSGDKNNTLLLDVVNFHMIRHRDTSTIISYHADPEWFMTSATDLHGRFRLIGENVYWRSVFAISKDPTFLLLALLWHPLYGRDEVFEVLNSHICYLEGAVMDTALNYQSLLENFREIHVLRAYILHYSALLEDFNKSVRFILNARNPAMESIDHHPRVRDRMLLERECSILLAEIERLQMSRNMQDERLQNMMHLVTASINLEDSKVTQRDSKAMKQISYLTMIFLPATFVAGVFGMNVQEINPGTRGTMWLYVLTVSLLTILTIWMAAALRRKHYIRGGSILDKLMWPVQLCFIRRRETPRISGMV